MSNRDYGGKKVGHEHFDWLTFVLLYGGAISLAAIGFFRDWQITAAESLLSGAALLTGGLLAALAQVASWRDRLTARQSENKRAEVAKRDSLDECVAHIVMAIYAAVVVTVLLAIAANILGGAAPEGGHPPKLDRGLSTAIIGSSTYLTLLLLVVLPRLWHTYADQNNVPARMGGADPD